MNRHYRVRRQFGLTLVEVLVALTIGLIVLTGVVGVLVANRQTYRTSEALARMRENARFSFEILGRSLRASGGNLCGSTTIANVLNNRSTDWWADWNNALRGYEGGDSGHDTSFPQPIGTSPGQRAADTDAVIVITGSLDTGFMITDHNPSAAQLKINTADHGLNAGEIAMACDTGHAAIFQITNTNNSNPTIVHNTGTETPGNCSKKLGHPVDSNCGRVNPNPEPPEYNFNKSGFLTKLSAHAWYVGHNSRGSRSLYRLTLIGSSPKTEEVVPDVNDLQIEYLVKDGSEYVTATPVSDWNNVIATRVVLTTRDPTIRDSDGNYLTRQWYAVFRLRNIQP